jgi:hypothetical protein
MKVIITHNTTKREIVGPFNMCMTANDALTIAEKLQEFAESGAVYGWIEISDKQMNLANTPPRKWDE